MRLICYIGMDGRFWEEEGCNDEPWPDAGLCFGQGWCKVARYASTVRRAAFFRDGVETRYIDEDDRIEAHSSAVIFAYVQHAPPVGDDDNTGSEVDSNATTALQSSRGNRK